MDSVANGTKYDCLLFDMDDTLYPLSVGLNFACRKNIQDYMLSHLQIEESKIPKMCLDLYKEYGTTMAGLKELGFKFDNDEFHEYVHGKLPYEMLKPDPVLKNLLLSMPQRKIIFTNADKAHAENVLRRLGLEECFEGVICFETLNPPLTPNIRTEVKDYDTEAEVNQSNDLIDHGIFSGSDSEPDHMDCSSACNSGPKLRILCKPSLNAIKAAIQIAKVDPKRTIFFDDSVRNIAAGKEAGLNTVIVGSSLLVPGADLALDSIHNVKEALPELWEEEDYLDTNLPSTVETIVLA